MPYLADHGGREHNHPTLGLAPGQTPKRCNGTRWRGLNPTQPYTPHELTHMTGSTAARFVTCPDCPAEPGQSCTYPAPTYDRQRGTAHRARQRLGLRHARQLAEQAPTKPDKETTP